MLTFELSQSRTYPTGVERAFDVVLPAPLTSIFRRRYGLIPAIAEVEGPPAWGTVGQTRTIRLGDGVRLREELTDIDRGRSFGYHIDEVMAPLGLLVDSVDGRWTFDPSGTGVRVTWTWIVHARSRGAAMAEPVFRYFWTGYARQALEELEGLLVEDDRP